MHSRLLLVLTPLALLAACGGDGPTTITAFDGSLSFTYSGANSGTFSASGSVPTSASAQATSAWAVAYASSSSEMDVVASAPRTATTHDAVVVFIQRNTVGSVTINSSCSVSCNEVDLVIGLANSGQSFTASCFLTTGTIAITEKSASRMKGTFSGTGTCLTQAGSSGPFTASNGTFDVAIVPNVP